MKSLIVIGASGVGKGTIIQSLIKKHPQFQLVISYTTRNMRKNQIDGKHYYFVDQSTFKQKQQQSLMLQSKNVFGNWYGTSKQHYIQLLSKNKIPLLDIDIQGMLDIRKSIEKQMSYNNKLCMPQVLCVMPPSISMLRQRLQNRGTQSKQIVDRRMRQNDAQINKMLSLKFQGLHFVTNYQYQLTVYGIQLLLANRMDSFRKHYWNNSYQYLTNAHQQIKVF